MKEVPEIHIHDDCWKCPYIEPGFGTPTSKCPCCDVKLLWDMFSMKVEIYILSK